MERARVAFPSSASWPNNEVVKQAIRGLVELLDVKLEDLFEGVPADLIKKHGSLLDTLLRGGVTVVYRCMITILVRSRKTKEKT
jgi:hypothetical protein